jgi:hypothetical protein
MPTKAAAAAPGGTLVTAANVPSSAAFLHVVQGRNQLASELTVEGDIE